MRKLATFLLAFWLFSCGLIVTAVADDQKTVNATVTPILISISVTPTSIAYGSQQLSTQDAVPTPSIIDIQNTGTINETLLIRGANTANWTLSSTAGTDAYVHKFSNNNSTFTPLTTSNVTLISGVIPLGIANLFLKMDMPTATAFTSQQTASVFITATQ